MGNGAVAGAVPTTPNLLLAGTYPAFRAAQASRLVGEIPVGGRLESLWVPTGTVLYCEWEGRYYSMLTTHGPHTQNIWVLMPSA